MEEALIEHIRKHRQLTNGASAAGARVHTLPEHPRDVADDGEFHYAVLGTGGSVRVRQAKRAEPQVSSMKPPAKTARE